MSCSVNGLEVDITVNYQDEICSAFSYKPVLSRGELFDYFRVKKPMLRDNSFGWLLYHLCQKRIIERISRNAYRIYNEEKLLKKYEAVLSDEAVEVQKFLKYQFPLISYIVWETRAFNEFSNHQLARNIIFVEVEKPYSEFVFDALHEQGKLRVLFRPSEKEIAMYTGTIAVAVSPLTSEAPIYGNNARLEKLLVDLFANTLLDKIISRGDYPGIYEEALSKYTLNYNVIFRYAKRRGKYNELRDFMENKVSIFNTGGVPN